MDNGETGSEFKIVGDNIMHCGGCESSIKFALLGLPGVKEVDADRRTQLISVRYSAHGDKVQPRAGMQIEAQIQEELRNLGYQVEIVRRHS